MNAYGLLPGLALPASSGLLAVHLILKGEAGFFEKVFLGFGMGCGMLSVEMFLLGLLRMPFGPVAAISLQTLTITVLFVLCLRFRGFKNIFVRSFEKETSFAGGGWKILLMAVLGLWVFAKTGFVLYESMTRPLFAIDAWTNWSAGGKLFYYNHGLVLDSPENFIGRGYRQFLGHPLLNPLMQVWSAIMLGGWDDVYVKTFEAFFFISLLGVFFFAIRREAGVFYATIGTFFLSGLPILTYHAIDAYSDLILSYFAFAGVYSLWRYLREGKKAFLILAGVFLGLGAFTKNEGLFFFIATGLALVLSVVSDKKAGIRGFIYLSLPFLILAGPWYLFKIANNIGFGHGDPAGGMRWLSDPKYASATAKGIHWEVLPAMFKEVFLESNLGLLFPFWIFATLVGLRVVIKTEVKYLYVIIATVMSMFFLLYLLLEVTAVTEATGIYRNIMTYAPIILFASLVVLRRICYCSPDGRQEKI